MDEKEHMHFTLESVRKLIMKDEPNVEITSLEEESVQEEVTIIHLCCIVFEQKVENR